MLGRVVDEGADLRVERIALLDPLPRLVVQFVAAPAVPFRFLVFSLPLQLQLIQQGNPHASGWSGFARRRLPYKTSRPRSDSPEGTGADNGVATSNSGRRISASVLCPPTPRDAVSSSPERGDPRAGGPRTTSTRCSSWPPSARNGASWRRASTSSIASCASLPPTRAPGDSRRSSTGCAARTRPSDPPARGRRMWNNDRAGLRDPTEGLHGGRGRRRQDVPHPTLRPR